MVGRSCRTRGPSGVVNDALAVTNRNRINTFALVARLPAIFANRSFVEVGGLISYAPNQPDMWRRAAHFVDKILRGANPGEIPVEQSTKFDLAVNLTTIKARGFDVPPTLLATAGEVIE